MPAIKTLLIINRGNQIVSASILLLLLWLSISFLMQAFTARQDARFLSRYLKTDAIIRTAVTSVADERSATHWLTGLEGIMSAENTLKVPHTKTDESLRQVFVEVERALTSSDFSKQLTHQPIHIRKHITNLRRTLVRLDLYREVLIKDLDQPVQQRNLQLQLSGFDYYGGLVGALEVLRHSLRYQPTRPLREVDNGLMISNAAWQFHLSHHVLASLFEGYITTGNTAMGSAYERALDMQRSVDVHWDQIRNIDAYSSIDGQLHAQAISFNDWFSNTYLPQVKRMTRAIGEGVPPPYKNWEWRKLALNLEKRTVAIFDRANKVSGDRIETALHRAERNLIIDTMLVGICFVLMVCAWWIGRRIHSALQSPKVQNGL